MQDDRQLLRCYAETGSESAFGELVTRYVNLVYSAALRQMNGDTHLAQDVAQLVFADLARKARSLPASTVLAGWLHRATRYAAMQMQRTERRRRAREQEAAIMNAVETGHAPDWEQIRPQLDEALDGLKRTDRDALLLRFFQQRSFVEVGAALGTNEEAARKRVVRALEQLRALLKQRGVTLSATTLGTVLAAEAVTAAPATLAAGITTAAIAGAGTGGATTTILKIMSMTKLKTAAVSAVVIVGVGASLVIQQQSVASLRTAGQSIQQQSDKIAGLEKENERLTSLSKSNVPDSNSPEELQRLQREAAALRLQTNALAKLREENRQLIAAARAKSPQPPVSLQAMVVARDEARARTRYAMELASAMKAFAGKNQGRYPASMDQVLPYLADQFRVNTNNFAPDQFDVVMQEFPDLRMQNGTVNPGPPPKQVVREKQPRQTPEGGWERIYIFVPDGYNQTARSPDGNFDGWEKTNSIKSSR